VSLENGDPAGEFIGPTRFDLALRELLHPAASEILNPQDPGRFDWRNSAPVGLLKLAIA
jgi:hypothetical protein